MTDITTKIIKKQREVKEIGRIESKKIKSKLTKKLKNEKNNY